MNVLLISNYPPDKQQSMLRYADMLQQELRKRGHTVDIVYPPVVLGGFSFLRGSVKKWIGYIDKYLFAPSYLRKKAAQSDIIHICDHSNAMYLKCAGMKPVLITCHDLLAIFSARGVYPATDVGLTGKILQRWIAANLSRAPHAICVSTKTQEDLETLSSGIRAKTKVIHNPLNWNYSPASSNAIADAKAKSGLAETEYLLHVGGNQWYKNRLGVMQIFTALQRYPRFQNVKLMMAGKPWTSEMRQYCKSAGQTDRILERVEIPNEELQALYSGALALLFPSREEGFGWPVLEAQACGCPVITSDRPPMTEIAGDAALFIDAESPELAGQRIAEQISSLPSLREAGFRNLERFAADKIIDSYLAFYEQVIRQKSAPSSI
jgi:glycosyltransferase involved in cell wall biosynthesis